MGKFYRKKKKNVFGVTIAVLLIAVIAGSVLAYFLNSNFKSKVNNVLKIEETVEESNKVDSTENTNPTSSVSSEELYSLKQQLSDAKTETENLNLNLNLSNKNIEKLQNEISDFKNNISNENLIINPNFTVISRGPGPFTRNGEDIYTADRWGLFKGNGKFIPSSHKLTGLDESQPTVFGQWVENGERFMFGETITVSATINDVRYAKTIQLPETYAEDYINNVYECDDFVFRIYVHKIKKVVGVQFLVVNGVSIKIYNVKLEVSPFETKYVDRSKREEVELCHKFYQELSIYSLGYGMSNGLFRFFVPTEARLRGIVKVNFKLIPKFAKNGELIELSETITLFQQVDNGVVLTVQTTDFVQNEIYYLVDGKVCVDGEFYIDF